MRPDPYQDASAHRVGSEAEIRRTLGMLEHRIRTAFAGTHSAIPSFEPTQRIETTYTARPWDLVLCDPSANAVGVIIPRPADAPEKAIIVKNDSDGTNAITITPLSGKIDGSASYSLEIPRGCVWLVSNGLEWKAISYVTPPLTDGTTENEVLQWDGSAWGPGVVVEPGTQTNQILTWDGSKWTPGTSGIGAMQPFELSANTVGLWHLNGTLEDSSPTEADLEVGAGTLYYVDIAPGKQGVYFSGSLRLDADDYYEELNILGDMTVMFNVQLDAYAGSMVYVAHEASGETEADNQAYVITSSEGPPPISLTWFQETGAGNNVNYTTSAPATLPPVHNIMQIAARRESGVVQFFMNGSAFGSPSSALTAPTGGTNARFRIGDTVTTGTNLRGIMWGCRVDNVARTDQEIKDIYNATLGPAFGLLS